MRDVASSLVEEGIDVLFDKLGVIKAIKFIQLLGGGVGDSIQEIETKTEGMGKGEALKYINEIRKKNLHLWKEMGLI